jgi:hypothetical protein
MPTGIHFGLGSGVMMKGFLCNFGGYSVGAEKLARATIYCELISSFVAFGLNCIIWCLGPNHKVITRYKPTDEIKTLRRH